MQLKASAALVALVLLAPLPAGACSLNLSTGGTLGLSADGRRLSSNEGGLPATFTIADLSLLGSTISISAPQLVEHGAGFNAGSAVLESSYTASWLLGSSSSVYSSSTKSFDAPGVLNLVVTMTLNNRIVSDAGFPSGTYTTRTIVTCS
ncbi:MAG: hypothetical protein EOP22_09465 [Hyphomicrobiales bacterium]|nr:MAG: hypothetical protein EOP22_09465 [Hyphomicrobiales bacterium]